jgi:hypothetical protein
MKVEGPKKSQNRNIFIGSIHRYFSRYPHKTSGFKTSSIKTSGFKTSEMSGLQNVSFTKCQVYKMSGRQNVWSSKPLVKKNIHIFSVLVVGGNPQVLLQPCLQAVFYSLF